LNFSIAHIPGEMKEIEGQGGLEEVLHQDVFDPENPRFSVVYEGTPPDMLRNEAQAILVGTMASEGVFKAKELLLRGMGL